MKQKQFIFIKKRIFKKISIKWEDVGPWIYYGPKVMHMVLDSPVQITTCNLFFVHKQDCKLAWSSLDSSPNVNFINIKKGEFFPPYNSNTFAFEQKGGKRMSSGDFRIHHVVDHEFASDGDYKLNSDTWRNKSSFSRNLFCSSLLNKKIKLNQSSF